MIKNPVFLDFYIQIHQEFYILIKAMTNHREVLDVKISNRNIVVTANSTVPTTIDYFCLSDTWNPVSINFEIGSNTYAIKYIKLCDGYHEMDWDFSNIFTHFMRINSCL